MREIIATVLAVVSCIVCLILMPKNILEIPKILANIPEGTDESEVYRIYRKARSKPMRISALCMLVTFLSLYIRDFNFNPNSFSIVFYISIILGFLSMILLYKFYRKLEKAYGVTIPGVRGNSCGVEGIGFCIAVGFAIYQIVLLFLQ